MPAVPEETTRDQNRCRNHPQEGVLHGRGLGLGRCHMVHLVQTRFQYKGSVQLSLAPTLHGKSEDVLAVMSRAGGRVAMASQTVGGQTDRAGINNQVGATVGNEVFLLMARL